jgi:vacuolar protein sorting-associated protein 13A/C
MSDKEYHVILACAASNIAEPKHAIPTFRTTNSTSGQSFEDVTTVVDALEDKAHSRERSLAEEEAEPNQRTPWTTNRVVVGIEHAELELFIGLERDASLASLLVRNCDRSLAFDVSRVNMLDVLFVPVELQLLIKKKDWACARGLV